MIYKVYQLNCHKSKSITETILDKKEPDILLLQEPYFSKYGPINHKEWIPIYAKAEDEFSPCRAITYIRSNSDLRALTTKIEKLTNRDMVTVTFKDITLVNVYNQPKPTKRFPDPPALEILKKEVQEQYNRIIIAGDYNLHHSEWESRAKSSPETDEIVDWLHENDMMLITPPNQKTYQNKTNIDLVYGSVDLLHRIIFKRIDEDSLSDHAIVEWDMSLFQQQEGDEKLTSVRRLNINKADWDKFDKELSNAIKILNVHNKALKNKDQIDSQAEVLEEVIKRAMALSMKEIRLVRKSKRYWSEELREKLMEANKAGREARQRQQTLALKKQKIDEAKKARRDFDRSLREASTEHWNNFLSGLEGNDIWKVLKYINPKGNDTIIPQIRKEDGTLTTTVEEKRHEIWKALLPEIDHGPDKHFEIDEDSRWPQLEMKEVDMALASTPNDKAAGDDGITGIVLKRAWENKDYKARFFKLLQACVDLGYHPKVWRHGIIVVIPKPKKPDYSKPRAYRPISLLKIPSKVLEKIIQDRMTKLTQDLLPPEQYGGRKGYCATDAVLELVQRVETSREKISAILIDIQGAFDNVNRNILAETMENMGLPKALISWTYQFISQREASMLMDRRKGPVQPISTGIPQGSPISPLLFLIYSSPMYQAIQQWGGKACGFIDDVTITVEGTIENNTKNLSNILQKCCEWAKSRMTKIDLGDKLGFIHFAKNVKATDQNAQLTLPDGELREPQKEVKLLGIILNNTLDFKSHILSKINKARKAIGAIWRLGGTLRGMRGSSVRSLYIACVRPIIEYGIEVWYHKILQSEIHKLEVTQNMALRRVVGAYRTTPIAVLQKEAGIMPYSIRLKFMVARKAIRLNLNISDTNPVKEHLLTLIEESPVANLTLLYLKTEEDRQVKIKNLMKTKKQLITGPVSRRLLQNQLITILKKHATEEWQEAYWHSKKDQWYHNITAETKCSDILSKMITGVVMKKDTRRILSTITQFRTGHGNFGAWFQKFGIEKDSYNCECGELETVRHILVECPLLEEKRKGLRRISPEMDMSTLLNSLTGLQEIARFISVWRE